MATALLLICVRPRRGADVQYGGAGRPKPQTRVVPPFEPKGGNGWVSAQSQLALERGCPSQNLCEYLRGDGQDAKVQEGKRKAELQPT